MIRRQTLKSRRRQVRLMDMRRAVARVCHYFPGEFREGKISGPVFFLLLRQVDLIQTEERVQLTQGNWIAQGLAFGDDSANETARKDREELQNG